MTALRGSCLCGGVLFEIDGALMRSSHCHCRQCQKAHGAPFRTRARVAAADFRFLVGEELVSFYESTPGTHRGFCKVCGAPVLVKFDEHSRSAQTDPGAVALYGVALATLDDDPGVLPRRARVYRRQGAVVHGHRRSAPIPGAYPRPERSPQFLTGRSHAIAVRAATLSVCWSFGEGTFAGKPGNGRDAPIPDLPAPCPGTDNFDPKASGLFHAGSLIPG